MGPRRRVTVGSLERTYFVYLPRDRKKGNSLPVVIALHGSTMNGPMMAWLSRLNKTADQEGFMVVYPDGTGLKSSFTWNVGNCCGFALKNQIDDVGFFRALLDDLIQANPIDPKRIYLTGMSNGAMLAYRLAAEIPDLIAAIAPVAGPMPPLLNTPRIPVPVIHFHGTLDEYTPFNGGKGARSPSQTDFLSVDQSIQAWVKINGCNPTPKTQALPTAAGDLVVTRTDYEGGKEGSEVVLVRIEGGGHTWPGRRAPVKILGRSVKSISANDLMWRFFQKHPKK